MLISLGDVIATGYRPSSPCGRRRGRYVRIITFYYYCYYARIITIYFAVYNRYLLTVLRDRVAPAKSEGRWGLKISEERARPCAAEDCPWWLCWHCALVADALTRGNAVPCGRESRRTRQCRTPLLLLLILKISVGPSETRRTRRPNTGVNIFSASTSSGLSRKGKNR